jgi:tRNA/rRNA methyltransferase
VSDLHGRAPAWFERIVFILVKPSHPGNVGAVARAMKTMGLDRLVLVDPVDPDVLSSAEARGRASGAGDVLGRARVSPDLREALADVHHAVAVSADAREFGPLVEPPEAIALRVRDRLRSAPALQVAFVFGPERTGLSIDDASLCQSMCSIPGSPDYHSLNLAQAAQILAYSLRSVDRLFPPGADTPQRPGAEAPGLASDEPSGQAASLAAVEGFFSHLETALLRIGFLDPARPKKLMPRMRRLFNRAQLEDEEVAILRGVCTRIVRLADQRDAAAGREPADACGPAAERSPPPPPPPLSRSS